jgi:phosphonate transport system substrate-binding protein
MSVARLALHQGETVEKLKGVSLSFGAKVGFGLLGAVLVSLLVAAAVLFSHHAREVDGIGKPGNPFVFWLSVSYKATPADLEQLSILLTEAADMQVEVQRAPDEQAALLAAGNRTVDAWLLPLFDYEFCQQEYGVRALLQPIRVGGAQVYHGDILVRADSPVKTLAELTGKRVAFVDPFSTSGFLYPARLLADAGAKEVAVFAGSHPAALAALAAGKVEAAATFYDPAAPVDPSRRVLARTQDIPNEPVFVRKDLAVDVQKRFADGLLRMTASDAGRGLWSKIAGIEAFAPVTDAAYEAVHHEIDAAGKELGALVPGGQAIYNDNRRPPMGMTP